MVQNIQALRALAVYLVVLVHSLGVLNSTSYHGTNLLFGHAGVDIFFVISGFIMVVTTDTREFWPGDFFWHRIVRVVPLYWLITMAVFAVALIAPALVQATRANALELVKSLLFIPFVKSNGAIAPVVFVGWTLNYEMFFYVLFACSLFLANRTLRLGALLATLFGLTCAGHFIGKGNTFVDFYTSTMMLEFGGGILLGAFWQRLPAYKNYYWLTVATLGLAAGTVLIVLRPMYWPDFNRAASFGIPGFLIVGAALVFERAGYTVRAGWILLLGAASYSIYLTHFFVAQFSTKLLQKAHVHNVLLAFGLMAVTAIIVGFAGILFHWYVELPLNRWIRNRTAGFVQTRLTRVPAEPALAAARNAPR